MQDIEGDGLLGAFGIEGLASRPGDPRDSAVAESTGRVPKRGAVAGRASESEGQLRTALSDRVNWCSSFRTHLTPGYMAPAEFREAGLASHRSAQKGVATSVTSLRSAGGGTGDMSSMSACFATGLRPTWSLRAISALGPLGPFCSILNAHDAQKAVTIREQQQARGASCPPRGRARTI